MPIRLPAHAAASAALTLLAGTLSAAPGLAQPGPMAPQVALDSALFVEHTDFAHGARARILAPATQLARGDRVVTLLTWYRLGGRGGFTVTDPLPAHLVWQGSADSQEEVSADGGRSWGHLGTLRIGARLATAADVTHVRWHVSPDAAETGSGTITFAGVVK